MYDRRHVHHRARIANNYAEDGGTPLQATGKAQAIKSLVKAIDDFRAQQEYAMPDLYHALTEDDCDPESEPEFGLEVGAGVAGCVTCSKESSVLDIGQRSLFCGGRYKKRTYI